MSEITALDIMQALPSAAREAKLHLADLTAEAERSARALVDLFSIQAPPPPAGGTFGGQGGRSPEQTGVRSGYGRDTALPAGRDQAGQGGRAPEHSGVRSGIARDQALPTGPIVDPYGRPIGGFGLEGQQPAPAPPPPPSGGNRAVQGSQLPAPIHNSDGTTSVPIMHPDGTLTWAISRFGINPLSTEGASAGDVHPGPAGYSVGVHVAGQPSGYGPNGPIYSSTGGASTANPSLDSHAPDYRQKIGADTEPTQGDRLVADKLDAVLGELRASRRGAGGPGGWEGQW